MSQSEQLEYFNDAVEYVQNLYCLSIYYYFKHGDYPKDLPFRYDDPLIHGALLSIVKEKTWWNITSADLRKFSVSYKEANDYKRYSRKNPNHFPKIKELVIDKYMELLKVVYAAQNSKECQEGEEKWAGPQTKRECELLKILNQSLHDFNFAGIPDLFVESVAKVLSLNEEAIEEQKEYYVLRVQKRTNIIKKILNQRAEAL